MALISKIKNTADSVDYNIRDDVHTWGGRNLATKRHIFDGSGRTVPTTIKNYSKTFSNSRGGPLCHTSDILLDLVPNTAGIGENIAISFDFKLDTNGIAGNNIHFYAYQGNGVSINGDFALTTEEKTTSWVRVKRVTQARRYADNGSYTIGSIYIYDSTGANYFSIKNLKIEHGNKCTDWSPAPEDIAYVNGTTLELLS